MIIQETYLVSLADYESLFEHQLKLHVPQLAGFLEWRGHFQEIMRAVMGHELRKDFANGDFAISLRDMGIPTDVANRLLYTLVMELERMLTLQLQEKVHHENYNWEYGPNNTIFFTET